MTSTWKAGHGEGLQHFHNCREHDKAGWSAALAVKQRPQILSVTQDMLWGTMWLALCRTFICFTRHLCLIPEPSSESAPAASFTKTCAGSSSAASASRGSRSLHQLFQSKVNNEVGPGGRELGVVPAKPAEAFCRAVAQSKVTEDPAIAVSSTFPPCADSPCSSPARPSGENRRASSL